MFCGLTLQTVSEACFWERSSTWCIAMAALSVRLASVGDAPTEMGLPLEGLWRKERKVAEGLFGVVVVVVVVVVVGGDGIDGKARLCWVSAAPANLGLWW